MKKAHQLKLYPTKSQMVLLNKSFGVARHSYNWALSKWKELYDQGQNPSAYTLIKIQNSIKREEMPFYLEVSKCAPQYAIHNLEKAYKNMWNGLAKYPKFKKKGRRDSFVSVENSQNFKQKNKKIWCPRIGWIKCSENLRFEGKVNSVTVKRVAGMYFAVINIDVPNPAPTLKPINGENQAIVGVDLGIKTMAVLSDGVTFENPKALKNNLKSLRRQQKSLSRKVRGSNNYHKQRIKVARKHYEISCIRNNAINQMTSFVVKNYDTIVIESLKPKNMVKNRCLALAVSDVSFGEIARQLVYKSEWHGKELIKVDTYFPSSKMCSNCGNKKSELKLSERTYKCENCSLEIDRDLNAAINLANYGTTHKSGGSYACGEDVSLSNKLSSEKQEVNILNNNSVLKYTEN